MQTYDFVDERTDPLASYQAKAFLVANGVVPRNVVNASTFSVDGDELVTWELEVAADGKSRVRHDGCCRTGHLAKVERRYPLVHAPEGFGYVAHVVGAV